MIKKVITILLSTAFIMSSFGIQANAKNYIKIDKENEIQRNYYIIDNFTGKLKSEGSIHTPQSLNYDNNWHTILYEGKSVSFKINSVALANSNNLSYTTPDKNMDLIPLYTGVTRHYSIANGQELKNSIISTIATKRGKVISRESSNENSISISTGFSIGKFLDSKNNASYSWSSSYKDVTSESVENCLTEKLEKQFKFDGFENQGYNSLDFYLATAYDTFNVNINVVENKDDIIINQRDFNGIIDRNFYIRNRPNFIKNYCYNCMSECDYIVSEAYSNYGKNSLYHLKTNKGDIIHLLHPKTSNYGNYEIDKLLSCARGLEEENDIGNPSRIVINTGTNPPKEIIKPLDAYKRYSDTIKYCKPYTVQFSIPWKYNQITEEKPDYTNQMVLPNTEKFVKLNGKDYLLRILESPVLSINSQPDVNSIGPIRESIAKGQTTKKSSSDTIAKKYSHEVTYSKNNEFNFNTSLGSKSLLDFCSFDIGFSTTFKSSKSNTSTESNEVILTMEEESTYSFPKEFYDKGNSLIITTTNDYITFLVKAEYIPVKPDGTLDERSKNIIELKVKQPSIKRYSVPVNIAN